MWPVRSAIVFALACPLVVAACPEGGSKTIGPGRGLPDAVKTSSTITVTGTPLPAVLELFSATITVTVRDASGPIAGALVTVSSDRSVDLVDPQKKTTDASGVVRVIIASNTPGTATVSATVALSGGASGPLIANAQVVFEDPFVVTAAPTEVPADGMTTSTVTGKFTFHPSNAVVSLRSNRNAGGTDVDVIEVVSGFDQGDSDASPDMNDEVRFSVRSRTPGTATLTVGTSFGMEASLDDETVDVTFFASVHLDEVASASSVIATPSKVPADGRSASTIFITLRDASGNPLKGAVVVVSSDRAGDVITQPASPTDDSGAATAEIRSTQVGTATVSVTVNPGPGAIALSNPAQVTFFVDPLTEALGASSEVAASPPTVLADGTSVSVVTVRVRGASSVPGVAFVVRLASSRGAMDHITFEGSESPLRTGAVTDVNGIATFEVSSLAPGASVLTATLHRDPAGFLRDIPIDDTAQVEFVDPLRDVIASTSVVTAVPPGVDANGVAASTIEITVLGANASPVVGKTVAVSSLRAEDVLTQPSAPTDADGKTRAQIRSTKAGVTQVAVTVDPLGNPIVLEQRANVTFVAAQDELAASSLLVAAPPEVRANGRDASTMTVTLKDAHGNPARGLGVLLSSSRGAVDVVSVLERPGFSPGEALTDENGVALFQVRSIVAGAATFSAQILRIPDPAILNQTAMVKFVTVLDDLAGSSLVTANPGTVDANGVSAATIEIVLRDANANPLVGATVTVLSNRVEDALTQPSAPTDAAGKTTAQIRSTRPGAAEVTVTVDPTGLNIVLNARATVTFNAVAAPLRLTTFTANPTRVPLGGSVVINWELIGIPTSQILTGATLTPGDRATTLVPSFAPATLDPSAVFRLTVLDDDLTGVTHEVAGAVLAAGGGRAMGNSVAALAGGGYAVAGRFEGTTTFAPGVTRTAVGSGPNLFVTWYDKNGSLLDVKTAGGGDYAEAFAAAAHPGGRLFLCGACLGNFAAGVGEPREVSFNCSSFNSVSLYFNADRTLRWAKRVASAGFDQCLKVAVAPNGDGFAAGQFNAAATFGQGERNEVTRTPAGSFDVYLARYAAHDGSLVFANQGGSSHFDVPGAVIADDVGGAIFVGGFGAFGGVAGGTAVFNPGAPDSKTLTQEGSGDIFAVRYRADGAIDAAVRGGGGGFESVTAAAPAPGGGVYIAGPFTAPISFGTGAGALTLTPAGTASQFLVRTDRNFDPVFGRVTEGNGVVEVRKSDATRDGIVALTGFVNGSASFNFGRPDATSIDSGGTKVAFVVTVAPEGSIVSARKEGGPGETKGLGIAAADDGTLFLSGLFSGTSTFGAGEPGENTFTATAIEEAFALRLSAVNSRTLVVRPAGLAFAKSAGSNFIDKGISIGAFPDGSSAVAGISQPLANNTITFGVGETNPITLTSPDNNSKDFVARFRLDGTVACAAFARQGGFGEVRGLATYAQGDLVVTGDFFVDNSITPGDTIVDPNGPSPIRLTSAGSTDVFVARFDKDCRVLWAKSAGAGANDQAFAVAALLDGGAAIAGAYTNAAVFGAGEAAGGGNEGETTLPSMTSGSGFLAVYNRDGTLRWVRRVGGGSSTTEQNAEGLAAYPNGDVVATGSFSGQGFFDPGVTLSASSHDLFLVRYSAAGSPLWSTQAFGGPKAFGKRVAITPDGDVIVAAEFRGTGMVRFDPMGQNVSFNNPSATATDVAVARYRGSDGAFVWAQQMAGGFEDVVRGLDVFPDGRIVVVGGFNGTATFGRVGDPRRTMLSSSGDFDEDIFVVVLEPNGDLVTVKQTGAAAGDERANGVAALTDGSLLLTGELGSATVTFGAGELNERTLTKVGGFRDFFFSRFFPYNP
jgi:hypothetical protein